MSTTTAGDENGEAISGAHETVIQQSRRGALPGGMRRRALRNAVSNWAGLGAEAIVLFLLTPFLLERLGNELYGVWILIGSLGGYLGLLDFGLRGSVGRYVAFYRGRGDHAAVLRTTNTALAGLTIFGLAALVVVCLTAVVLQRLFEIPAEHLREARWALVIVGVNVTATFIFTAFDALVWGYERFDLTNLTTAVAAATRGVGAALVVSAGQGLVGLAITTLAVTVLCGLAKAWVGWRVAHPCRLSWSLVSRDTAREIGPFGFWYFLVSLSRFARSHLNPLLVGVVMGPAIVTPFSISSRLVGYVGMILMGSVNVLAPALTSLVGQGAESGQRGLVIGSGRICAAFALFSVVVLSLGGNAFLTLWVGPEIARAWSILAILAVGEALPMTVHPYNIAAFSQAEQRPLAWLAAAECATGLALGALLGQRWGLHGFAIALAAAATCFRGLLLLIYGEALLGLTMRQYLREAVWPVVRYGVAPVFGFVALMLWREPDNWLQLVAFCTAFAGVYGFCMLRAGCANLKQSPEAAAAG